MHRAHLAAPLLAALMAATASPALAENKPIFKFSQAYARARDAHVNKRGNRPQAEKVPPLKRIADPSNLVPIVPPSPGGAAVSTTMVTKASASANLQGDPGVPQPEAIKVAAQIKTQEDLKGQKIKALKYLGTIGCGCYNDKFDVEKALLEALEDCTEEVRLEAVRAIIASACSDVCKAGNGNGGVCDKSNCCSKAIRDKLAKMAYGQDKDGCWLEPSERVRNAAVRALNACAPYIPADVEQEPRREPGLEGGVHAIPPVPPNPPTTSSARLQNSSRRLAVGPGLVAGSHPANDIRSWTISDDAIATASAQAGQSPKAGATKASPAKSPATSSPATRSSSTKTSATKTSATKTSSARPNSTAKASQAAAESSPPSGTVLSVDPSRRIVELAIEARRELPQGTRLQVFHRYLTGNMLLTEVEVVESAPGRATARALDMTKFAKVSRGDEVTSRR